ncbi:Periplasmic oligopeptide-binding protein precursor [Pseudobythopirellula maris]|uniref:Periplasmic oligopeptide-binding protein n=1 Tax=Pseudobythopirellula maris TaxID=2527991 RepID=A0A5C5ZLG7_9BACT|nr:peptide ABC transporter substrate-binding protein [Pseudobythopirellula maris]TWT88294.1 Periplasmic oligopeptide-binding protein precursor [Pseudobythopirellula maris]
MPSRLTMLGLLLVALLGGVARVVSLGRLPAADFTFTNETEIESLDPAVVTGQPEGRVIWSLYEGLVRQSPKDNTPQPGVAERWDVSEDGLTYTFHLREDAKWSNGEPITADDFVYSMRRFLDPLTVAEYAYQAWYLKNGRRYSQAARGVEVGDSVEIELHELPAGAAPFARGRVLRGELVRMDIDAGVSEAEAADPERYTAVRTFVVDLGGEERRFRVGGQDERAADATVCKQLLLDFGEVGFRALDDRTVETVLESPTAYWLDLLAFYPLSPVNRECLETHGSPDWMEPENIVTNGAYRLKLRRLRDRIRLQKNPHYWDRDNVAIETIDALAVESYFTAFNLYATGEVDWVTKAEPLIARELKNADPPRDDYNPAPMLTTYFYIVNVRRPPLSDVRVRKALAMALDRSEVIDTATAGETPARSLCPPGLVGYESPLCPAYDPEEARRLLADAGFPGGVGFPKLEIHYNTNEAHQTIAELVRKQWQKTLGVEVSLRNEEWGTYLSTQRQGRYDVSRRAWGADYPDPNTFLDMFVTGGENNSTGWSSEEYDRLIREAAVEVDAQERLAMLHRAEEILVDELPLIPFYFYVSRNLVRPHVRGFWNNAQDQHPLRALSLDRAATGPNEFMAPDLASAASFKNPPPRQGEANSLMQRGEGVEASTRNALDNPTQDAVLKTGTE